MVQVGRLRSGGPVRPPHLLPNPVGGVPGADQAASRDLPRIVGHPEQGRGVTDYTDFQRFAHLIPQDVSRILPGGKGGGKTVLASQCVQIRQEEFGVGERALILRQEHRALHDLKMKLERDFNELWGPENVQINHSPDGVWRTPRGGTLEFGILPDGLQGTRYVEKIWHGQSLTYIYVDEAGQYSTAAPIDRLRSNLRSGSGVPCRMDLSFNPGGAGHQWIKSRYIGLKPWKIHDLERAVVIPGTGHRETIRERLCVCPSSYRDNPHLPEDYLASLVIAAEGDDELYKAWTGIYPDNWNIARGAYFAAALENPKIGVHWPLPERHIWTPSPRSSTLGWLWDATDWRFGLAYDHGTSAPAACYVMAYSPGGMGPDEVYYPRGSVVVLDEWTHHVQGNLAKGLNLDVDQIAPHLVRLAERWEIPAKGVADDQIKAKDGRTTIQDLFRRHGVHFEGAQKGAWKNRAPSCTRMRQMLRHAGHVEEPGLYIDWERCPYLAETLGVLQHDPKKDGAYEDTSPIDHGADAVRYGIGKPRFGMREVKR